VFNTNETKDTKEIRESTKYEVQRGVFATLAAAFVLLTSYFLDLYVLGVLFVSLASRIGRANVAIGCETLCQCVLAWCRCG